jgi:hypothetical protein
MTDLERDDRALIEALEAELIEARAEVDRERAKLKSECEGCERTARLGDKVVRLDASLKTEVLAYEKQVVGMMDQMSVLNAEVARLTDTLVRVGDINLELESLILERLPENTPSIPLEEVNEWLDGWNRRAIKALLSTENEDRWRLAPTEKLDGLVTSLRVEPGVATPKQVQARYKATLAEVSRAIIDRLERENKDLLRDALILERVKAALAKGGE